MLALVGYLIVGVAVLAPSLRPGHTLVPTDLVTAVQPYNRAAGGFHAQNPNVSDATFQFFPWVEFLRTSLEHGHLPQWNPTILAGTRMTPNGNFSPYYPPILLARWLSAYDTYNLFVLFHLVAGALGVYALARVVGARRVSSWVAGLLSMTAMFWIHWSLHLGHLVSMALLPWMFAAVHLVVTRPTPRRVAALAVAFGLCWLGGNPQYAYYGTLAMGAYAAALLVRGRWRDRRALLVPAGSAAAALLIGAALAGPALLPAAAVSSHILRARETEAAVADSHLEHADLIRIVVEEARGNPPDHVQTGASGEALMDSPFTSVTALVLAGAAIAARRRLWWVFAAGALLVLLLGFTAPLHHLLYHVPGYDRFRVSARWLALLPVFVLPLAALGADALLDDDGRGRAGALGAASLILVATVAWWVHERGGAGLPHVYLSHRAMITIALVALLAGAALVVGRARWLTQAGVGVLVACALFEVFFHAPRWYPDLPQRGSYPPEAATTLAKARGGRLVHVDDGPPAALMPVAPDIPMVRGVSDVQGFAPFITKDYDRYMRLVRDYGQFAGDFNAIPPITGQNLTSPLLDALDVRTAVSTQAVAGGQLIGGEPGADFVYGRTSPGAAVLVAAAAPADEATMWLRVADPRWDPRQTAAVLGLATPITGASGGVRPLGASSDGDAWAVDSPTGGFLRVSGQWDAGWRASVDGRRTTVLRADGIFRGVVVPRGRHTVRFSYADPDAGRGLQLAAGAVVVLVALWAAGLPAVRRRLGRVGRAGADGQRVTVSE
ncbi:MAG: hypothetical protein JO265_00850 [Acidimicrobiia bacterium]|nr:hypothetical protein [Acidimicrobiia bacterium]